MRRRERRREERNGFMMRGREIRKSDDTQGDHQRTNKTPHLCCCIEGVKGEGSVSSGTESVRE